MGLGCVLGWRTAASALMCCIRVRKQDQAPPHQARQVWRKASSTWSGQSGRRVRLDGEQATAQTLSHYASFLNSRPGSDSNRPLQRPRRRHSEARIQVTSRVHGLQALQALRPPASTLAASTRTGFTPIDLNTVRAINCPRRQAHQCTDGAPTRSQKLALSPPRARTT